MDCSFGTDKIRGLSQHAAHNNNKIQQQQKQPNTNSLEERGGGEGGSGVGKHNTVGLRAISHLRPAAWKTKHHKLKSTHARQ